MTDQAIKVDIELLKKDIVTMSALLEKFDTTIDKMQEIASNLSRMISLQEQRIEVEETATKEMQSILEMRRIEHNQEIKELHSRITTVNRELTEKINDTEQKIIQELQHLREDLNKKEDGIGARLSKIEMWKYAVGLVVIVLAWIAGQTKILSKFIE